MADILIIGPVFTLILVILVLLFIFVIGRPILWLIVNSIIGIIALAVIDLLPFINIPINIWSVLIVAIGGIPGLIILVILNLLGIIV